VTVGRDNGHVGYDPALEALSGHRHFSQAIAEGDGISIIVAVDGPEAAHAAEDAGAEAIVLHGHVAGVREATELPILWRGEASLEAARAAGADAFVLDLDAHDAEELQTVHQAASEAGIDCVVEVSTDDQLEQALEWVDPEIVLLVPDRDGDADADLDTVLRLLHDVPAGKLAVVAVAATAPEQVAELERAGVDAVIVGAGDDVAGLVGGALNGA
jgi:indole-3-glycerol phosphate synthase